jgi:hypothetical protein
MFKSEKLIIFYQKYSNEAGSREFTNVAGTLAEMSRYSNCFELESFSYTNLMNI